MEDLAPGIREATIALDPTFQDILDDNISAYRDENIGRNWKIIHTFQTSVAGTVKAEANMEGDTVAYGANAQDASIVWSNASKSNLSTWQNISYGVAPGAIQRTIALKRWKINLFIPIDLYRSDQLSAAVGKSVAMTLKGTAKNVASQRANMFFTPDATHKYIGKVDSTFTAADNTTVGGHTNRHFIAFTVDSSTSRIRRFQPGMMVEFRDASNSYALLNNATDSRVIIRKVDPVNSTVYAEHIDSTKNWAVSVAAGDIVVLAQSYASSTGYGPSGLETWLKAAGAGVTAFGLDFAEFPQFGSYVKAFSSPQILNEQVMRKYVGGFMDQRGPDEWPDTCLTTAGVLADYVGEFDGRGTVYSGLRTYDSQGKPINVKGGFAAGPAFSYDGHEIGFRTGPLVQPTVAYIYKFRQNIRRYTPPMLPKAGSMSEMRDGDVEFVAPLLGFNGIFMPVTVDDSPAPYVQAPAEMCEEYCPEVLQGIKLSNLTEFTVS